MNDSVFKSTVYQVRTYTYCMCLCVPAYIICASPVCVSLQKCVCVCVCTHECMCPHSAVCDICKLCELNGWLPLRFYTSLLGLEQGGVTPANQQGTAKVQSEKQGCFSVYLESATDVFNTIIMHLE